MKNGHQRPFFISLKLNDHGVAYVVDHVPLDLHQALFLQEHDHQVVGEHEVFVVAYVLEVAPSLNDSEHDAHSNEVDWDYPDDVVFGTEVHRLYDTNCLVGNVLVYRKHHTDHNSETNSYDGYLAHSGIER